MVKKKVEISIKSSNNSWEGFEILEFVKGRKRVMVGAIGAVIGYLISDQVLVGLIAGLVFEMGFAGLTYYIKKR